ncbi:uncharacterized protein EI97DRAFT_435416 [Westerdykella ornata]|uniref:Uncharacterized protein n=1 Tax=Westerdykella ornata TaxID=318751 RepID=A0A6A6JCY8_WESOR|nr:uncharacterized protein EI97DRAFT_435416 [Westerdykella ornata]KAF2274043.1 hypothetical protein EI97DRAFT_435416 [Westerdykella ornata]
MKEYAQPWKHFMTADVHARTRTPTLPEIFIEAAAPAQISCGEVYDQPPALKRTSNRRTNLATPPTCQIFITMSDKKQGGNTERKSDSPNSTTPNLSSPNHPKLYITIVLVLLLLLVAYVIRYEPICIFTCAPLFSPKRHYPTRVEMTEICGSPIKIDEPHCMTVPVVVPIIA